MDLLTKSVEATRSVFVFLALTFAGAALSAQEVDDVETPVAEEAAAVEESPEDVSNALRANLEETIHEGEKVLQGLPKSRQRILRARLSNLKRQLRRKTKERHSLEDSLSTLRADFYRRNAALQRSKGSVDARILAGRERKLKEDYELHAESFEQELKALDADISAIHKTISELEARTLVAQRLEPLPPVREESESTVTERVLSIPEQLNPFVLRSLVTHVRGRDHAPRGILWAIQGEINFQREDFLQAERYWMAALDAPSTRDTHRTALLSNLALISYTDGDYASAYRIYTEVVEGRDPSTLLAEEAYTLAVLSYLNGLVKDARVYLAFADDEGRARMRDFLTVASAPAA